MRETGVRHAMERLGLWSLRLRTLDGKHQTVLSGDDVSASVMVEDTSGVLVS